MAGPENLTLRELRSMRDENRAIRESMSRVVELLGRVNEGISNIRADIASLRAESARVQGDVILLENQNFSRHGETISILRRLEPLEELGRELAARAMGGAVQRGPLEDVVEMIRGAERSSDDENRGR